MGICSLRILAEKHRDSVLNRAHDVAQANPTRASELLARVELDGKLSVNMKPSALRRFLRGEPRLNMFQWADRQAHASGRTPDEVLQEHLGPWYNRRVEFERYAGAHFHYGALNIGGMGSPRFGRFCVVDGRGFAESDPIWVAHDSLRSSRIWIGIGATLSEEGLSELVAPHDMVAQLALIKLDGEPSSASRPLEERICREDEYIEGLTTEPVEYQRIQEVRSETDDSIQARALAATLDGASQAEELDLGLHAQIRQEARRLGIDWVEVQP